MCRMLIATGNIDMNLIVDSIIPMIKDETKDHEFHLKVEKGNFTHFDGWGIAYRQNGNWVVHKSIKPFHDDPELQNIRSIKTDMVIIHIRRATKGKVVIENTHPFVTTHNNQQFLFSHNGTVHSNIEFDKKFDIKGNTDSEQLFYSILTDLKLKEAHIAVQENLAKYTKSNGSNIFLSNNNTTVIGVKKSSMPQYYHMYLGEGNGTRIICSERLTKLPGIVWRELEGGSVATLDHETREIIVH